MFIKNYYLHTFCGIVGDIEPEGERDVKNQSQVCGMENLEGHKAVVYSNGKDGKSRRKR